MYRSRELATIAVVVLAVAASACGGDPPDNPPAIANPASEFCLEQGGELEIVDEPDGQVGYCNLPDGTRVEEWEFYRANSDSTDP